MGALKAGGKQRLGSELEADVVGSLDALGLEPRREVCTPLGYSVDVVVSLLDGREVAVEVDGPGHFFGQVTLTLTRTPTPTPTPTLTLTLTPTLTPTRCCGLSAAPPCSSRATCCTRARQSSEARACRRVKRPPRQCPSARGSSGRAWRL